MYPGPDIIRPPWSLRYFPSFRLASSPNQRCTRLKNQVQNNENDPPPSPPLLPTPLSLSLSLALHLHRPLPQHHEPGIGPDEPDAIPHQRAASVIVQQRAAREGREQIGPVDHQGGGRPGRHAYSQPQQQRHHLLVMRSRWWRRRRRQRCCFPRCKLQSEGGFNRRPYLRNVSLL